MTARQSIPFPPRPDLDALIKRASDLFDQLMPQQQAAHRAEQRRSWVIGELMLAHPDMTHERAIEIYEQMTK